jgi:hypothetical protein
MNLFLIIVAAIIIGSLVYAIIRKAVRQHGSFYWIPTKRTKISAQDIENAKRRSGKFK